MKSFKEQLDDYTSAHQHKANQLTHYIGIPAIVLGVLLLLSWVSVSIFSYWHITFSWIAIIIALIYYFQLNVKLAAVMTVILVILTLICSAIAFPKPTTFSFVLFLVLFIGGWILQFVGHAFEKNKPSFTTGLTLMFIAPMYLLVEAVKTLRLGKYFDLDDTPDKKVLKDTKDTKDTNDQ